MLNDIIADHYGPKTAKDYDQISNDLFWQYPTVLEVMAVECRYRSRDLYLGEQPIFGFDLGAGTGNLSTAIFSSLGESIPFRWILVDQSSDMLEMAKPKIKRYPGVDAEYRISELTLSLNSEKDETIDLIVSSFAIHHLSAIEKMKLIEMCHRKLKKGGVLVIGDKMSNADYDEREYRYSLQMYAQHIARQLKMPMDFNTIDEISKDLDLQFEMDGDRPSTLSEHKTWLNEFGFTEVVVPYYCHGNGIVTGVK